VCVVFGGVFFAVGSAFAMFPATLLTGDAVVSAVGEVLPVDLDFPPPVARPIMKSSTTTPMTPSRMPFSFRLFRLPPPPGPEPGWY